jgi:hypothetical protein
MVEGCHHSFLQVLLRCWPNPTCHLRSHGTTCSSKMCILGRRKCIPIKCLTIVTQFILWEMVSVRTCYTFKISETLDELMMWELVNQISLLCNWKSIKKILPPPSLSSLPWSSPSSDVYVYRWESKSRGRFRNKWLGFLRMCKQLPCPHAQQGWRTQLRTSTNPFATSNQS